jgi:hypothetical protein
MTWMNGSWVKAINLVLITVIGVLVNIAKSQKVFSIHVFQSAKINEIIVRLAT